MENRIRNIGMFGIERFKSLLDIDFYKSYNIEDVLLLSGSPRSGTTWLMEILSCVPKYKSIFEPFNSNWFPEFKLIEKYSRMYLEPDAKCFELDTYLRKVFTGKARNPRGHYKFSIENLQRRYSARKLLIKLIRANRLLPWISTNFNLRKIYLLTRHPCAVISSQLKTGITGYYYLPDTNFIPTSKVILNELSNYSFDDEKLRDRIKSVHDKIGLLSLSWGLDHYVPFKEETKNNWNIVRYEDLLLDYKKTVEKMFREINESKYLDNALELETTPSLTTFKGSLKESESQHNKWKKNLSNDDIKRIEEVLNWFDITVDNNDYSII